RPCPTFGRPVRLRGGPHRLRPGTSPHALQIPPHGGHPALRVMRGGCRSPLAVSGFRLRARIGFSIPSSPRPARHYPRFWIRRPSFGRRRDLNPPDHYAAQRTLWPRLTSHAPSRPVAVPVVRIARTGRETSQGKWCFLRSAFAGFTCV